MNTMTFIVFCASVMCRRRGLSARFRICWWCWIASSLSVQAASRAFFETFGVDSDDTIGQPFYALGNGQWDIPELRRLLEDVIPRSAALIKYQVEHNFPRLGQRTMLLTADPMSDMPTFIIDSGPSGRHD
ncbi:hypothetical protein [Novosphingobium sp.]|uniref:hypothetical protein n=1 Tax=Novosphingobium sp. TaxID=1874826 RepID=UPI0031E31130